MGTLEDIKNSKKSKVKGLADRLIPRPRIGEGTARLTGKKIFDKYVDDVLSGKQVACQNVIASCERQKYMETQDDIYFDEDTCDDFMEFSRTLKVWMLGGYKKQPAAPIETFVRFQAFHVFSLFFVDLVSRILGGDKTQHAALIETFPRFQVFSGIFMDFLNFHGFS